LFPDVTRDEWRPALPTRREISFSCPHCKRKWQARIIGDDAVNLPLPAPTPVGTDA